MPCLRNSRNASRNSSVEEAAKRFNLIYPVCLSAIYAASKLYTGIFPRTILNSIKSGALPRFTFTRTSEPFGPRRRFMISVVRIFTPAITVSFTSMIRSPAINPTFSEGPPGIT